MNKLRKLLYICVLGLASSPLFAQDLQQKVTTFSFVIEEKITRKNFNDIQNLFSQYDKNSGNFRLVLRNVIGVEKGHGELFLNLLNWIDKNEIEVAASGLCVKECGQLFLSAHKKILLNPDKSKPPLIVLQAIYNKDGELLEEQNNYLKELIIKNSKNKFPAYVFDKIFNEVRDDFSGVFISPTSRSPSSNMAFSASIKERPEYIEGYTLEKLGILAE